MCTSYGGFFAHKMDGGDSENFALYALYVQIAKIEFFKTSK
jgi:hypothetical protein